MNALGRTILLVLFNILLIPTIAAADTVGTYYITDYSTNKVYMVNGHTLTSFSAYPGTNETPIAVSGGTVRLENFFLNTGHVYSLSGTQIGTNASPGLSGMKIYDATTDGTNNYFVFGNNGTVYKTGLDYSSGTALFTGTPGVYISYDPTNNSLWLSGGTTSTGQSITTISDYSMDGTLLSSFDSGSRYNYALAFDPADSTLWVANPDSNSRYNNINLVQYSRTGSVVSTMTVTLPFSSPGFFGGEFGEIGYVQGGGDPPAGGSVPEPTTLVLLGSGLFGLRARIRRK